MNIRQTPVCLLFLVVLLNWLPSVPLAAAPVDWQIDLSTTGQDVFWSSPTAISLGLPEYDWSYEVTKFTAQVFLLGEQDLLGSLEDFRTGGGTGTELPIVLIDEHLQDSTTGSSADFRVEVDAAGFGRAAITNITLGSFLGLPIQRVDFSATVNVLPVPTGDYNRDGNVDLADYEVWRSDFGSTTSLNADGNNNAVVDAADYSLWRDNLGAGMMPAAASSAVVPEPASAMIIVALFGWMFARIKSRRRDATAGPPQRIRRGELAQ